MPDKPTTHLNLDSLDREGAQPEPFGFILGGDRFVCIDPQELDYRAFDKVEATDLEGQFRVLLGGSFDKFRAKKMPLWKVRRLSETIMEHYGMGDSVASPTS